MPRGKKNETAVEVRAEDVMLDEATSLADVEPSLRGETVTADLSAPAESQAPEEQAAPEAPEPDGADGDKDRRIQELEQQVSEMREMLERMQSPQVVQVTASTEKVTLRFQSECSDENTASFGPNGIYGQITGKTGTLTVPKTEWSRFLTSPVRYLLDTRQLIVLSGLSEEEMDLYGVNYREGELLDRKAFMKLLDLGDELLEIFPGLCDSHKQMIAKRFLDAYVNGDPRAMNRDLIVKLNDLSKAGGKKGLFNAIIKDMNKQDEESED